MNSNRTLDENILKSWIGTKQKSTDWINIGQAQRMQSTLDNEATLNEGDTLPPLWHWIYFLESTTLSMLGQDGHAKLGTFIPPVDLPCRMWAGGKFKFKKELRIGECINKTSTIKNVEVKSGRSGKLCFVTVHHEFFGSDGDYRLSEEHEIVYRENFAPDRKASIPLNPPTGAVWSKTITPTSVLLFRYSALTFNGHRIHYDRDYSRNIEGYGNLVFHGPLTATLLASLGTEHRPGSILSNFMFRGTAPLFDDYPFTIHGKPSEGDDNNLVLWAETPNGDLAMTAKAEFSN